MFHCNTCAVVYTTEESTQWLSMRVFLRFSFSCILAFLGGPREARGRLTAPGALRRRPRFARRGALRAPRFKARTALRAVPGLGGLFGFADVSSLLMWTHP